MINIKNENYYFNTSLFEKTLFTFSERGREGEREEEKHQWAREASIGCLSHALTKSCNPGMCPDWESNQQPFTLRDDAPTTEPHQLGQPMSLDATIRLGGWEIQSNLGICVLRFIYL